MRRSNLVRSVLSWPVVYLATYVLLVASFVDTGVASAQSAPQCSSASPASADSTSMSVTDRYDHLGIRTGPSTDCEIQQWLEKYDVVTRSGVDQSGAWSYVTATSGLTGWVESNRLVPADGAGLCSGLPPVSTDSMSMSVTDRYDHLGLRTGPSTDCEIQQWLEKYEVVTRTGVDQSGAWSYVTAASGLTGWVESDRLAGADGTRLCSGVSPINADSLSMSVTDRYDHLGLRTGPSTDCEVEQWLEKYDVVTRTGVDQSGAWSYVTAASGLTGWVESNRLAGNHGTGLCSGVAPVSTDSTSMSVTDRYDHLGLRTGPSTDCDVQQWLKKYDVVTRTGVDQSGAWSYVTAASGMTGWVESDRLAGADSGPGGPVPTVGPFTGGKPVVILDTDMGPDIDDALALAMIHTYVSRGQAQLGAVTLSRNSIKGAQYIDLLNTFYGRPDIPIGIFKGSTPKDTADIIYTGPMVDSGRYPFQLDTSNLPSGHEVMRAVLESSPDNGVVIIQVGFSTNTARLLQEYPELVARKAALLSVMGGDNPINGSPGISEFNIENAPSAAQTVFANWPTTLIQSDFDLGYDIVYPLSSIQSDFNDVPNHPIKESYLNFDLDWHENQGAYYNMRSWDLTSVIAAIDEPSRYFPGIVGPGRVSVNAANSLTTFQSGGGNHYVLPKQLNSTDETRLVDRMIDLVSAAPSRPTQALGVDLVESPFQCDGQLRPLGTISGFAGNESVKLSWSNGGQSERAAVNGTRSLSWRCNVGGSTVFMTAVGMNSGRSTSLVFRTEGYTPPVQTAAAPRCYNAERDFPLEFGPVQARFIAPGSSFDLPTEPYPHCLGNRREGFGSGDVITVVGTAGGYLEVAGGGWVRANLTESTVTPVDLCRRELISLPAFTEDEYFTVAARRSSIPTFNRPCSNLNSPSSGSWRIEDKLIVVNSTPSYFQVGSIEDIAAGNRNYRWVRRRDTVETGDPVNLPWCPTAQFNDGRLPELLPTGEPFNGEHELPQRNVVEIIRSTTTKIWPTCADGVVLDDGEVVFNADSIVHDAIITIIDGRKHAIPLRDATVRFRTSAPTRSAWGGCLEGGAGLGLSGSGSGCVWYDPARDEAIVLGGGGLGLGLTVGGSGVLMVGYAQFNEWEDLGGFSVCSNVSVAAGPGIAAANCYGIPSGAMVAIAGGGAGIETDVSVSATWHHSRLLTDSDTRMARDEVCAAWRRIGITDDAPEQLENRPPFCGQRSEDDKVDLPSAETYANYDSEATGNLSDTIIQGSNGTTTNQTLVTTTAGIVLQSPLPASNDSKAQAEEDSNNANDSLTGVGGAGYQPALGLVEHSANNDAGVAPNIVDLLVAKGNYTILVELLELTDLADTLRDTEASVTAFAPVDETFAQIGEEALRALRVNVESTRNLLKYHLFASDAQDARAMCSTAPRSHVTAMGKNAMVTCTDIEVFVNGSRIVDKDNVAGNGIVHGIDTMLSLPQIAPQNSLFEIIRDDGRFNTLTEWLVAAGLDSVLSATPAKVTLFAPTDKAFAALDQAMVEKLTANPYVLRSFLQKTVVPEHSLDIASLIALDGQAMAALNEDILRLSVTGGALFVDTSRVVQSDVVAANGVVHVIDTVLIPEAIKKGSNTLWDLIDADPAFSTLRNLLLSHGLDRELKDTATQQTVFLPNNDAFGKHRMNASYLEALRTDKQKAARFLNNHRVPGANISFASLRGKRVRTTSGAWLYGNKDEQKIWYRSGRFWNSSFLKKIDLQASNGIAHAVSAPIYR